MSRKADATARALLDVTMLLMRSLAARMRKDERRLAPAHVGMLAKIDEQPCGLSDLAQHLAVRLPTISKSVSVLVERGLVERWTPPENRRRTMVRLTAEGRRALEAMKREAARQTAVVLDRLTGAEHKTVSAALEILGHALSQPSSEVTRER